MRLKGCCQFSIVKRAQLSFIKDVRQMYADDTNDAAHCPSGTLFLLFPLFSYNQYFCNAIGELILQLEPGNLTFFYWSRKRES